MKKLTALALSLLMLLGILPGLTALAEDTGELPFRGIPVAFFDGAVYALDEGRNIMVWRPGDGAPSVYLKELKPSPQGVMTYEGYEALDASAKETVGRAVTHLVSGDDGLYGINLFTGQVSLITKEGAQAFDAPKEWVSLFESTPFGVNEFAPQVLGGSLVHLAKQPGDSRMKRIQSLVARNLKTNEIKTLVPGDVLSFGVFGADKLVVTTDSVVGGEDVQSLATVSLSGGALSPLSFKLPGDAENLGALAYDDKTDSLFIASQGIAYRSVKGASFEPFSPLGLELMEPNTSGYLAKGVYVIAAGYPGYAWVKTDGEKRQRVVLCGEEMTPYVKQTFASMHPDVDLYYETGYNLTDAQIAERIRSGDGTDLFMVWGGSGLKRMIKKGYAAPLTDDPAFKQAFELYFPFIQSAVSNAQGDPCGIPVGIDWSSWTVTPAEWKKAFGERPYPKTFLEIYESMAEYNRLAADGHLTSDFTADWTPAQVLKRLVSEYAQQYETTDKPLSFDTPAFRDVASALARGYELYVEREPTEAELMSEVGPSSVVSPFGLAMGLRSFKDIEFNRENAGSIISPVFTPDQAPLTVVTGRVLILNPNAQNKQAALDLMKLYLNMDANVGTFYSVRTDATEPRLATDGEERLAFAKEHLRQLEESLAKLQADGAATEHIQQTEGAINRTKDDLQNLDRFKWSISEEQIAGYRAYVPRLRFFEDSLFIGRANEPLMNQVEGICQRFIDKNLDLDGFVAALDNMAKLAFLENKD